MAWAYRESTNQTREPGNAGMILESGAADIHS
jgi:hypothetical protein